MPPRPAGNADPIAELKEAHHEIRVIRTRSAELPARDGAVGGARDRQGHPPLRPAGGPPELGLADGAGAPLHARRDGRRDGATFPGGHHGLRGAGRRDRAHPHAHLRAGGAVPQPGAARQADRDDGVHRRRALHAGRGAGSPAAGVRGARDTVRGARVDHGRVHPRDDRMLDLGQPDLRGQVRELQGHRHGAQARAEALPADLHRRQYRDRDEARRATSATAGSPGSSPRTSSGAASTS